MSTISGFASGTLVVATGTLVTLTPMPDSFQVDLTGASFIRKPAGSTASLAAGPPITFTPDLAGRYEIALPGDLPIVVVAVPSALVTRHGGIERWKGMANAPALHAQLESGVDLVSASKI